MRKFMIGFFLSLIVFCVVFVAYVRYLEAKSLFYPTKGLTETPKNIDLSFEEIYFQTQDNVKLHGWFIPVKPSASTLLFMHGNAGNISGRLGKIGHFHDLGLNIFIFDYRGFGKSEGHPTEAGMYLDAAAAYDYLVTRHDIDTRKIIAYGASLGGVAAIDLAAKKRLAALIVDSSFSSAADMGKHYYPFVPSFLLKVKLDNLKKIEGIVIPKLFFHSPEDQTVPFNLGKKLFEKAQNPKTFVTMKGGHNDSHMHDFELVGESIQRFLKEHNLY